MGFNVFQCLYSVCKILETEVFVEGIVLKCVDFSTQYFSSFFQVWPNFLPQGHPL